MARREGGGADRALLVEVLLVLVLIGLGIVLYWRPAAEGLIAPRWWAWVVLGTLFFGVVGLDRWRRGRRAHRELHEAIREDADARDAGGEEEGEGG